jgi:hypothetical protein
MGKHRPCNDLYRVAHKNCIKNGLISVENPVEIEVPLFNLLAPLSGQEKYFRNTDNHWRYNPPSL